MDVCDEQDARLQLIYTVSSALVPIAMLFGGILFEQAGTFCFRIMFCAFLLAGYLCIATSSPGIPNLLFPGFVLIGIGGISILVASFEVANLFPAQKSIIIAMFTGGTEASSFIMFLVKLAYDGGVPMQVSFFTLAGSIMLFSMNTFLLPRSHIPWPLPDKYRLMRCCRDEPEQTTPSPVGDLDDLQDSHAHTTGSENERETAQHTENERNPSSLSGIDNQGLHIVSLYTNIFVLTSVALIFLSPFAGLLFNRNKRRKGFERGPYADLRDGWLPVTLSIVAAVIMSCLMMVTVLTVQLGTFVFLTLHRATFYGASGSIIPITFPMHFYASVYGMINFISGIASFIQYPLFLLIQDTLENNPRWVIAGYMFANIFSLSYPAYIYWYASRQESLYASMKQRVAETREQKV